MLGKESGVWCHPARDTNPPPGEHSTTELLSLSVVVVVVVVGGGGGGSGGGGLLSIASFACVLICSYIKLNI